MRDKISNVLWGAALIAIGVIVFGKIMDFWEFSVFFPGWWTLFFIFPSLVSMIKNGIRPVNSIFMLSGVILLLEQNHVLEVGTLGKVLVPAIFFAIGLFLLARSLFGGEHHSYNGRIGYSATFGGNVAVPMDTELFEGCEADAVFGGLDLDLRNLKVKDGAVIEADAIFGGINIKVPAGVNVKLKRTEIFGGAKNHIQKNNQGPTLYVNALCLFGGVDIK